MNCCVECEIKKAKTAIESMMRFEYGVEHIAAALSEMFNVSYYVTDKVLYRANLVPPHTPYKVWVF